MLRSAGFPHWPQINIHPIGDALAVQGGSSCNSYPFWIHTKNPPFFMGLDIKIGIAPWSTPEIHPWFQRLKLFRCTLPKDVWMSWVWNSSTWKARALQVPHNKNNVQNICGIGDGVPKTRSTRWKKPIKPPCLKAWAPFFSTGEQNCWC